MARLYIVEARGVDGALAPDAKQPPFKVASSRQLADHYMGETGRVAYPDEPESLERVREWYTAQGWTVREKTW